MANHTTPSSPEQVRISQEVANMMRMKKYKNKRDAIEAEKNAYGDLESLYDDFDSYYNELHGSAVVAVIVMVAFFLISAMFICSAAYILFG